MTDDELKHLEFIQGVITRMNTNSFQLKGWAVTLVSALLAIAASTKDSNFVLIGVAPAIVFWFLDAFYLMQERKFRGLYDDIAGISDEPKELKPFEMRPDLYVGDAYSYWSTLTSRTIAGLYLPISIGLISLFGFLNYCQ